MPQLQLPIFPEGTTLITPEKALNEFATNVNVVGSLLTCHEASENHEAGDSVCPVTVRIDCACPRNHLSQQPFRCLLLQRMRCSRHRKCVSFCSRLPVIIRGRNQPFELEFPE